MGIPDYLTCLLRNLLQIRKQQLELDMGTTDGLQIGKGVGQGCILSLCLFNLYVEYIMRNAGIDKSQAGSTLLGEITTSDMQMTPRLWRK